MRNTIGNQWPAVRRQEPPTGKLRQKPLPRSVRRGLTTIALSLCLGLGFMACAGPSALSGGGGTRPDATPRSLGVSSGPPVVSLAEPLALVDSKRDNTAELEVKVRQAAQAAGLTIADLEALRAHDPTNPLIDCEGCAGARSRDVVLDTLMPFSITPEIRAFAERNTRNAHTPFQRITALVQAIYVIGHIEQQYEAGRTASAHETLVRLRGNCFSFTNLLVASARAVGISAYFMDASRSSSSLRFDGQRMLHAGHIVAGVPTNMGLLTIDFYKVNAATEQFWYQRLTDEEAVALFINNLGYNALKADQNGIPYFQTATLMAPRLEAPWNNLATVMRANGREAEAQSVLEQAVARHPGSFAPYYNLGLIYLSQGDNRRAQKVLEQAMVRRMDSPFIFMNLGLAYARGGHVMRAKMALARSLKLDASNEWARTKLERLKGRH